ncbi:MAG TPA: ZIP family metal transporter [Balneolaceae bacterium]|nr:ZIP family metal transporter [Balneolaceae bacterium]
MTSPNEEKTSQNKHFLLDILTAGILFFAVIGSAFWVVGDMSEGNITVFHVFVASTITAVATGFGALPFLFINKVDDKWLGIGNAVAAGLMLGASVGLIYEGFTIEGVTFTYLRVIIGATIGVILVYFSQKFLNNRDEDYSIGNVQGADAVKMLMIVGIMTVHSFAEGIGVGVSFGDSHTFGAFISIAIAIHNIPEGLAISLILIPRGTSVRKAAFWSIFSSLPQPLMAIPAFLFVLIFKQFLPAGLGLAAGAMFWMVFKELIPEAEEELSKKNVYIITAITAIAMMVFQFTIEG